MKKSMPSSFRVHRTKEKDAFLYTIELYRDHDVSMTDRIIPIESQVAGPDFAFPEDRIEAYKALTQATVEIRSEDGDVYYIRPIPEKVDGVTVQSREVQLLIGLSKCCTIWYADGYEYPAYLTLLKDAIAEMLPKKEEETNKRLRT